MKWCSLQRDNWSCVGDKYIRMLKTTAPFKIQSFNLFSLPSGTKILAEGNSYVAELIIPLFCESSYSSSVDIYKLDGNISNSYLYKDKRRDIELLLIDNDSWDFHPEDLIKSLLRVNFKPTLILLGHINDFEEKQRENRHFLNFNYRYYLFSTVFANSIMMNVSYNMQDKNPLPANCRAPDCGAGEGHQCLPGEV